MRVLADRGVVLPSFAACVQLILGCCFVVYCVLHRSAEGLSDQLHTLEKVRCADPSEAAGGYAKLKTATSADLCGLAGNQTTTIYFLEASRAHSSKPLSVHLLMQPVPRAAPGTQSPLLTIGYQFALHTQSKESQAIANGASESLTDASAAVVCRSGEQTCLSQELHRIRLAEANDYRIDIRLIGIFDAEANLLPYQPGQLQVVLRSYNSRDKDGVRWVKAFMCFACAVGMFRLVRSLRESRLKERLSIQMILKYLSFLLLVATLPFFDAYNKSTSAAGVFLLLVESLFISYLSVFLLIILPSVALERSAQPTRQNRGWKQLFLLANFLSRFGFRLLFFRGLEAERASDAGPWMDGIRLFTAALDLFSICYCLVWVRKTFRAWGSLEQRYKSFTILTAPFLPLFCLVNLLNPVVLDSSSVLVVFKWTSLPLYVCLLQVFFTKLHGEPAGPSAPVALSMQPKKGAGGGKQDIPYTSALQLTTTESHRTEETDRGGPVDSLDFPQKHLQDNQDQQQAEEISYELENGTEEA